MPVRRQQRLMVMIDTSIGCHSSMAVLEVLMPICNERYLIPSWFFVLSDNEFVLNRSGVEFFIEE